MKKYLFIYAVAVTAALLCCGRAMHKSTAEHQRLTANQQVLVARIEGLQTSFEGQHGSIERLQLRCREYEALRRRDAATIRSLGLRLRRVESVAKQGLQTEVKVQAPLRDTLILRHDTVRLFDTVRCFAWRDAWVSLEGEIGPDSLRCRVVSVDTLQQILHRVPHRFLFLRWGTKAVRQEIRSSNPHTRLVYADYVVIKR